MNAYEAIATRQENAFERLVSSIEAAGEVAREDAVKVANYYLKHKLAKLDAVDGQFTIKHGVFFEPDVIANAVAKA